MGQQLSDEVLSQVVERLISSHRMHRSNALVAVERFDSMAFIPDGDKSDIVSLADRVYSRVGDWS